MSHKNLIVTLISDDKPGIVSQVSKVIAKHNGNWLDSHLVQLAGKFTGLLRLDVPEEAIKVLSQDLKALRAKGIDTLIEVESQHTLHYPETTDFELSGPDRTGIVSEISNAFEAVGVSIDEMQTHCSSTPWSGEPLFEAKGALLIPQSLSLDTLEEKLQAIEDELAIDIRLSTKKSRESQHS